MMQGTPWDGGDPVARMDGFLLGGEVARAVDPDAAVVLVHNRALLAPDVVRRIESVHAASTAPFVFRTRARVEALFDGLDLLPPGVRDARRPPTGRVHAGIALEP